MIETSTTHNAGGKNMSEKTPDGKNAQDLNSGPGTSVNLLNVVKFRPNSSGQCCKDQLT